MVNERSDFTREGFILKPCLASSWHKKELEYVSTQALIKRVLRLNIPSDQHCEHL